MRRQLHHEDELQRLINNLDSVVDTLRETFLSFQNAPQKKEKSRSFFPSIPSSHPYQQDISMLLTKINTYKAEKEKKKKPDDEKLVDDLMEILLNTTQLMEKIAEDRVSGIDPAFFERLSHITGEVKRLSS